MKYFRKSDILVTLAVLAIEAALIALYYMLIFSGNTGRAELGTVYFKERIATRRQTDVFHWQSLYNGAPLYEYDTLRTASGSEATIHFLDGTQLDIYENSLVKLEGLKSAQFADIQNGSITVANTGGAVKQITLGGKVLNLLQNASALITQGGDGETNIQVQGGTASITDGENEITLSQLQMVQLLESGLLGPVKDIPMAPMSPAPNKKIIVENGKEVPFTFAANDPTKVKLVISSDANFTTVHKTIDTFSKTESNNVYTCTSDVPSEKIYWKLVYDTGEESEVMALTVLEAPSFAADPAKANLTTVSSDDGEKVQFSWESVEQAVSYLFEVSKTSDFQTTEISKTVTNTSTNVTELDEGEYYWRVTPNYQYETVGNAEGATSQFTVKKTNALIAIKPVFPPNNYKVKLSTVLENGFSFSWQPNSRAQEYTLNFYTEDSNSPVESFTLENHTASTEMLDTKMFDTTGKMYWSVTYKNADGTTSPESVRNLLTKIDERSSFHTIFPQNDYTIASSMIRAVRFTWENETLQPSIFTISKDSSFNSHVIKKRVSANSYLGTYLMEGKYYWRVELVDEQGNVTATSEVRSFTVIPNLAAVNITEPQNNTIVPLLAGTNVSLKWEPVKYADYYEVAVYAPNGARIIHVPYSEVQTINIPVANYEEGNFRITVQAFSLDNMAHTKNTGLITSYTFNSKEIDFIKLLSPANNARISGVSAFNDGVPFKWTSDDEVGKGTFQLRQNNRIVRSMPVGQTGEVSIVVNDIPEGTYSWRVVGDFNGYEISSKEENRLTILPIEPLQVPRFASSKQVSKIDVEYLKTKRTLHFEWSPVSLASYYVFTILDANGKQVANTRVNGTSYDFSNLEILSSGEFRARVRAVSTTQLRGRTTESQNDSYDFVIDLKAITKPESKISGEAEYYGY